MVQRSGGADSQGRNEAWVILPVFAASVYGGYFGAGLSIIVLAVLALVIDDTFTRLSALKQAIAFSVNIAAATFFLFSGRVVRRRRWSWPLARGRRRPRRLAGRAHPA